MPRSLVSRLARAKAESARDQIANDKDIADAHVLAADTIVAVGRRILVKPRFVEEALAALQLLSGRNHRVITGLCMITPDDRVRLLVYAPMPEELFVEDEVFGTQRGYVLYSLDVFPPES